jgi:hypothetical protein
MALTSTLDLCSLEKPHGKNTVQPPSTKTTKRAKSQDQLAGFSQGQFILTRQNGETALDPACCRFARCTRKSLTSGDFPAVEKALIREW